MVVHWNKMPGSAILRRGALTPETGGPAFEVQPPNGGPAPVRDPRAADWRLGGVRASGLIKASTPKQARSEAVPFGERGLCGRW